MKTEFLFYRTPPQFRNRLDGESDPNREKMLEQASGFREMMEKCTRKEYLETILKIHLSAIPNPTKLAVQIVKFDFSGNEAIFVETYRLNKDIKHIAFEYDEITDSEKNLAEKYRGLTLIFADSIVDYEEVILNASQGKAVKIPTPEGDKYMFDNSAIDYILVKAGKEFLLRLKPLSS